MQAKNISAATAKTWLDRGEAVLVDVREPFEHHVESIPGAILVPLAEISASALPEHRGRKVIVHCLKGARGLVACDKLLAEDPALEVYNLEGGIGGWSSSGLKVNRPPKN